ncbi:hypothetical protein BU17DRAFT_104102 [Hysterangium stoloniferum]|nr:hypothetical protein BU17DRAFT_104102 [Hysterangium stoloniferum]
MGDDDEATDQKVLAGTSTQTDLSPAFAILSDIPVTALLPVVPFVHHVVSCQLNPRHGNASATTTAMDRSALTRRRFPDELMSSPDPVPRTKSSPPDFPEFKYQEIPLTPSPRSPADGHPRRPYRDEAKSDGSSASMPNPKNQNQYEGHGDGSHVSKSPSSGTGTSSDCRRTKRFKHKSLTPQPHYARKRKARQDKLLITEENPQHVADASVRQHLYLTLGGNRSESQSRMSNNPPQRSAKTLGGPLAAQIEPLLPGPPPPKCNRRRKKK